jgi:ADP-ribose pyrophosphatase YjhB (NUDIX family)
VRRLYIAAAFLRNTYWRLLRPVTVGVGVVVRDDQQKVLLVKPSYINGWTLPGGAVERGETLRAAACRELFEETGVFVDPDKLLLHEIYFNRLSGSSNHAVIFIAKEWQRRIDFVSNSEIIAAEFFELSNLPHNLQANTRRILAATQH